MASRVRVAVYGCTMNTLLLVSVPFAVVTVIGPVVAPSGTVALISGIDELEACGCTVEENLACIGEALSQDLHHARRRGRKWAGRSRTAAGQHRGYRRCLPRLPPRQHRCFRRDRRWCAATALPRMTPVAVIEVMEPDYVSGQGCAEDHS